VLTCSEVRPLVVVSADDNLFRGQTSGYGQC